MSGCGQEAIKSVIACITGLSSANRNRVVCHLKTLEVEQTRILEINNYENHR